MLYRRFARKQSGASKGNPKGRDFEARTLCGPVNAGAERRGGMMTAGNVSLAAPAGAIRSRAEFGSDYIVEVIRALGIEFAAFNPGSSFRGIHDSLINFGEQRP